MSRLLAFLFIFICILFLLYAARASLRRCIQRHRAVINGASCQVNTPSIRWDELPPFLPPALFPFPIPLHLPRRPPSACALRFVIALEVQYNATLYIQSLRLRLIRLADTHPLRQSLAAAFTAKLTQISTSEFRLRPRFIRAPFPSAARNKRAVHTLTWQHACRIGRVLTELPNVRYPVRYGKR